MKRAKLPLAAAAVFVLALALCPRPPGPSQIEPTRLLEKTLAGAAHPHRTVQTWNCVVNGRHVTSSLPVSRDEHAPPDARMTELLRRNFTPLIEGEDTIAGRAAWVLRLRPHIKRRPWRQLWIDRESGAVLAVRDWDHRNRLKRAMRITPIVQGSAGITADAETRPPAPADRRTNRAFPLPRYIPRGYEVVESRGLPSGGAHVVLSDGLYPITILIRFPDSRHREHTQHMRLHDWGQGLFLSMRRGDKEVTLVGDLPSEELERMARSLL